LTLAKALKYERIKRGMTQKEFAKFLETNRSAISYYESGRKPAPATLKIFSKKLKLDLARTLIEEESC